MANWPPVFSGVIPLVTPLADRVLFIDGEAIILDKPAGLPVDAPRDGSLSLENHLGGLTFGFQRWPLPVHRLDRDTSGCLLLARNPKAHKRFAAAFEAGTVQKRYLALLAGAPEESEGTIDIPLGKRSTREAGWRMVPDKKGKAARTHWKRVAVIGNRALVAFTPETGRTHQIRVHALHGLGHAIVGDPVYGAASEPMLLHSRFLSVARGDKKPAEATAPLPDSFTAAGVTPEMLEDAAV